MPRREEAMLMGAINQHRCMILAMAAIISAMAEKTSVSKDEVRKRIHSCHIFGEELSQHAATVEVVEKIIDEILK